MVSPSPQPSTAPLKSRRVNTQPRNELGLGSDCSTASEPSSAHWVRMPDDVGNKDNEACRRRLETAQAIAGIHGHCAVFTKADVAEAILDVVGWRADQDLSMFRLLEPSCGDGSFLAPAVERLLVGLRRSGKLSEASLVDAVVAFEFDKATADKARERVRAALAASGIGQPAAGRLSRRWVRCSDFLLARDLGSFSHVVGNPPYMRWSKVPTVLRREYEAALPAASARGDLCLAFIGRAVELTVATHGRIAFLCADRWLRCSYGTRARSELGRSVRLATHIDVHDVAVFQTPGKVGAYAAVTVLDRDVDRPSHIATVSSTSELRRILASPPPVTPGGSSTMSRSLPSRGGALIARSDLRSAFEAMTENAVPLKQAGVEVRCGVALGAASVFIVDEHSPIERDRLVPFLGTKDLGADGVAKPGKFVLNVWSESGALVDLSQFPKLRAHLEAHETELRGRACVVRPEQWFRTIDRIDPQRVAASKIVVAGMSKWSRVAMSSGGAQASNALYCLTSAEWPLHALFALFRSGALDVFATILSPRFSGGTKRFDGNLFSQVRIPTWSDVDRGLVEELLRADLRRAFPRPELISALYGVVSSQHRNALATAMDRPLSTAGALE